MPLAAIQSGLPNLNPEVAQEIAFHLSDWRDEAAFLVALNIAPELFTQQEIEEGVTACLIHIPNHIAAAAKLAGWKMKDIFNVGATIEPADPKCDVFMAFHSSSLTPPETLSSSLDESFAISARGRAAEMSVGNQKGDAHLIAAPR